MNYNNIITDSSIDLIVNKEWNVIKLGDGDKIVIGNNSKKGYLPSTNKLDLKVINYTKEKYLFGESAEVVSLFFILFKETEIGLRKTNGYAPISYEVLKKYNHEKDIKRLIVLDLLDVIDYKSPSKYRKGRSREYRIKLNIYTDIASRIINRAGHSPVLFNAITGKAINKSKNSVSHEITKFNKYKKEDELIVSRSVAESIIPIEYCCFDYLSVEERLDYLKEQIELGIVTEEAKRLAYLNDERCYRSVLENKHIILQGEDKNIMVYAPRYRTQSAGRISEIGGGFQSCSREQKHLAFANLNDVRNYDLKSSQIYGLKYQFMSARLNYELLEKYITGNKLTLAAEVNVDVDTWKGITYGSYFGGFPTSLVKIYLNKSDEEIKRNYKNISEKLMNCEVVYKHVAQYLDISIEYNPTSKKREMLNISSRSVIDILNILRSFYKQNKELLTELSKWHKYLSCAFIKSNSILHKNEKYIRNRSDMFLNISPLVNPVGTLTSKGKRKVAAHLLQGQEACFISRLTWYSESIKEAPYDVISNQADGLVVRGYIPESYVEMARKETGFSTAYLEEKPYL